MSDAPWLISLFRIIDPARRFHFAADDQLPADADRWRELKRHVIRMNDGLDLVHTNLREEREHGMPFTADTARKIEGYGAFWPRRGMRGFCHALRCQ